MVSKHISIWIKHLTVRIGRLNFQNKNTAWSRNAFYFATHRSSYLSLSLSLYIYIYRGWLFYFHKHMTTYAYNLFLRFQCPNDRSEPFILFSILICAWRPNFTIFGIFLLFIKPLWKLLIRWSRNFYCFYCSQQNNNFQKCLINSKKIPKNVKFGLQAHFNMD